MIGQHGLTGSYGGGVHPLGEECWNPAEASEIPCLVQNLAGRIRECGYRRDCSEAELRLEAVLEEAVLNAWIHGNKQDPLKSITVRWKYDERLMIEVIDEGEGFDHSAIPDPTAAENLTKPNGRGVFIIRYFAERVAWEKGGQHMIITL